MVEETRDKERVCVCVRMIDMRFLLMDGFVLLAFLVLAFLR